MDAIGIDFTALLPAFMRVQEDDAAMAAALSPILRARALQLASLGIADFLCDADALLTDAQASTLLDSLAAYLGLEWWRADWDTATKRSMMAQAEKLRQLSESKWALETILRAYFGDPALTVEEWWDYGGAPYCFRVLTSNADAQAALRFKNVIELIKRQSQQWEGLWAGFSCRGVIYRGALGTDDTRLTGEAVLYRYLPTGTTVDGADGFAALSAILTAANPGQDVTDVLDDCFDYDAYTVTADLPLTFQEYGLPDWQAIPSTRAAGTRLDAALTAHWSDVGADVESPAIAYQWPPSGGGSADLLRNIFAHWSFGDGTAFDGSDSSGNAHALINSGMADSQTGLFGGCIRADGDNDLAGGGWTRPLTSVASWTLSLWIRRSAAQSATRLLASWGPANGTTGAAGIGLTAAGRVSFLSVSTPLLNSVDTIASDGEWHHVAVTYDATDATAAIWINGQQSASGDVSAWTLGAGTSAPSKSFRIGSFGLLAMPSAARVDTDEVSIWTERVLSQSEISALWNGGLGLPFEDWT